MSPRRRGLVASCFGTGSRRSSPLVAHAGLPMLASLTVLMAACGGADSPGPTTTAGAEEATVQAATAGAVCFYEHVNYQGLSFCADASSGWVGSSWNDRISSVKVTAGYKVDLYEHINYGGRTLSLSADAPNLVSLGFNDAASSLRIAAPPTSPVRVATVQLAQSMLFNSDDSALVLVAGKAALVKVNVTSPDPKAAKPAGTLRVENANGSVLRDLVLTAPTTDLPGAVPQVPRFEDSYTATIPADLVRPGLRLTATIGNSAPLVLSPRVGGGVPMKFIPISVQIAGVAGRLPANQAPHLQALFPVSSVQAQSHPTYVSGRVTTLPTTDAAWSDAFGKILGELADLHTLEGAARHDHYFGFIPKRTWGLAGLAYVRGNSGVGFDMPDNPTTVRDVVAHELGHNFSLPHAACGGAGNPDPNYPYPDANLGKPGRYVWPFLADSNAFYDPRPTDRHDIMSYCGGQVFSDYNYRVMQVYLTPSDRAQTAGAASAEAPAQELLLVSGEVGNGRAELNPVKALVGKLQPAGDGPYTLRVVTAAGATLDYPFALRVLDHDSALQHFGLTIPHPGSVQSLSVLLDGRVMASQTARVGAGDRRSANAASPQVQVHEANGVATLAWDAARFPFLTVTWVSGGQRRNLAQDLRGGTATLPTAELGAGGGFELVLSDGVNASRVQHNR
jgi:hypothetical protein